MLGERKLRPVSENLNPNQPKVAVISGHNSRENINKAKQPLMGENGIKREQHGRLVVICNLRWNF